MKRPKILNAVLAAVVAISTLTLSGCDLLGSNNSTATQGETLDTATRELRQNDYRGGVIRTQTLQSSVINIMEGMKVNNTIIRQDSPNSYWTADGYQDFVSTFLNIAIINDTQWFNEEETAWETILAQIVSTPNSFSDLSGDTGKLRTGISITRNEKDDYGVTGVPALINITLDDIAYSYSGSANYRILYDCDKDWCKAYATLKLASSLPAVTVELFEYQRIDNNTFIIQTSKERLMVVLAPVEADTDIRNREVVEFYYSKLVSDGYRTTYTPFELLPETDSITNAVLTDNRKTNEMLTVDYPLQNLTGALCDRYGESDSMFFRSPKDITRDWVFEDKALQQGIVYKDGILVVTTYNKLSTYYERFIYSKVEADTSGLPELEALVEIENLVGVQQVEIKNPPPSEVTGGNANGSDNAAQGTSEPAQSGQNNSEGTQDGADTSEANSDADPTESESGDETTSSETSDADEPSGSEGE